MMWENTFWTFYREKNVLSARFLNVQSTATVARALIKTFVALTGGVLLR